jgi:hypothetical protein
MAIPTDGLSGGLAIARAVRSQVVQDLEAGSRIVSIGCIGAVDCVGAIPALSVIADLRNSGVDHHRGGGARGPLAWLFVDSLRRTRPRNGDAPCAPSAVAARDKLGRSAAIA